MLLDLLMLLQLALIGLNNDLLVCSTLASGSMPDDRRHELIQAVGMATRILCYNSYSWEQQPFHAVFTWIEPRRLLERKGRFFQLVKRSA